MAKDLEEGRLLACTDTTKKLGLVTYTKIRTKARKRRWIYNLKTMLDDEEKNFDKLVLPAEAPKQENTYIEIINGEYYEFEDHIAWTMESDGYENDENRDLLLMTFKNCNKPTAGAVVGRTPFLLFVGTWNTELQDSTGKYQSKERVIEKMKASL